MEPRAKEWMLATARGDYHAIARLLREEPRLARRRVRSSYLYSFFKVEREELIVLGCILSHVIFCLPISFHLGVEKPVRFLFLNRAEEDVTRVDERVVTVNFSSATS
jgi:hypothetical protein